MEAKPQAEHQWLEQLLGDWTFESECNMGPDAPPIKNSGTQSVRSLGGMWVICEGQGEMPGGDIGYMMITLGYDPKKGRFVGTFVGSMMSNLWIYDGQLDAAKRVLTLDAEGPNFEGTGLANYQDSFEIVSPDHHILRSQVQTPDGSWMPFMESHYRRAR